ncbi:MAG: hypothetical protein QG587_1932, partial [Chloroflexota bacterium]|nr:hypothetical protein [Chloroflexota bacterium]
ASAAPGAEAAPDSEPREPALMR